MSMSTVSPLLKIGLGAIGMWPGSSYGTFCWLFYMTTLVTMQYFQYSYVYAHLDFGDLTKLMDGLGLTLDYTLTILKLISLWFNRRLFADILVAMDNDWKDRATDLRECVMMDKANLAHRCSNAIISVNAVATVLYFIDSHVRRRTVSKDGQHRDFPIQIQFPFEAHETPVFEFVVLGLFFHVLETATVIATLNSLILTLVLHVSGQIDIMCQELKEIPPTFNSKMFSTKSLVERHQKIISLSNNIENYFSFIALLQFIWNSFVICCLGFMVVISLDKNMESKSGVFIQFMMPYIAVTIEAFVFCFAGEYLSTKSRSIGDAAYEAVWYDLSTSECRILLFLILRSQKRLTITAGKVMDLTLESFTTVLHVSGQIDIMCQGLREISSTRKSHPSATRSLIKRHQKIISLSNNINNFFSFVALIQFVWNTIVICTIGVMIVISLGTDIEGKFGILIQSIIPYVAVTLEAFVFCFAGEYLSSKSRSIGDAAYEAIWYELSTSECQVLLLIIVRSQKRLSITAGKVMDMTLEGFTTVMKASMSYISVLHAMY
ncbi:odorant receptor 22c-like [Formica exsecta]|uniref:odorant receptor 22c-like n=1 Tax=Formica exsecta TaxID=72781 RepID=UPI001141A239|nr:odorant receptor 22c-like [Formica exsecta]